MPTRFYRFSELQDHLASFETGSHGVANGVAIVSQPDAGTWGRVYVTLSYAYARVIPPGYPDPNPGVNLATSQTATPKAIPNGTRVLLFQHEAAALVAAAVAAYS